MVAIQDSYLQGKSIGFVGAQISRAVQTIPDKTGGSRENSEQCRIMGELQDYDLKKKKKKEFSTKHEN